MAANHHFRFAAQLAKVGIVAKIENVEWAQWLSQVFAANSPHNFDLTIVSHVEPFDLVKITEPDYYLGYNNEAFNAVTKLIRTASSGAGPWSAVALPVRR